MKGQTRTSVAHDNARIPFFFFNILSENTGPHSLSLMEASNEKQKVVMMETNTLTAISTHAGIERRHRWIVVCCGIAENHRDISVMVNPNVIYAFVTNQET